MSVSCARQIALGVRESSGSGSIIGRDPLPPRALSTSQLAAQNPLTQPPVVVSTLPHARVNGRERQQITTGHPVHQSTPQSSQSRNNLNVLTDNDSSIDRAASINDVQASSTNLNNETSSESSQRLVSPSRNLRVISPIDHRVSSPSDSEKHIHNSNDRNLTASPINTREMNGDSGSLRQMHRTSTIPMQKSVTSELESRSGSTTTGSSSRLVQVSAGELLGRTHEELVLLLIQLRRQSAVICKAMETCHMEIEAQARLADLDAPRRLENLQKLEELKKHLMNLEKQYEKGKPLVNLVDNMVKLGSLYNRNGVNGSVAESRHDLIQNQENTRDHRDRLEFNQRVQEQRLLAEERRDWERLSPDHGQLQAKVQQLYKLDRLLQEESGTLHSLQQDKEILEKALGGLRHKLQGSRSNPVETERYRKQQILLERELSRVRMLLAHNSKKLEETVAENARLEQDLVVLRQKLQASRRYTGNITKDSSGTTAALEAELRRVQQLVGDLQRQRQELSIQVRQLTEKSHSLVQQIKPNDPPSVLPVAQVHHSKKRTQSSWLETDLDSGMTFDHGLASPSSSNSSMSPRIRQNGSPHQQIPLPQYKDPPSHRYSPTQSCQSRQIQSNNQPIYVQPYSRSAGDNAQSHNHITALSPQLRAQIQQHQLKQQLLKDQMQGKASPIQSNAPLYVNTDPRRINCNDGTKRIDSSMTNGISIPPPKYIPPPPPPPLNEETFLMNGNYTQHDDNNKIPGSMQNREKQEIKTVRIVKRESERRQRDRGDRSGNIGIPLTNGIQTPGGAKRIADDEFGSQQFDKAQLDRVIEETPMIHAQSTVQLSELDDIQFQRSMSLPRGFGGQRPQPGVHNGPLPPPPRSDSMNALRNMMARRHRARFENPEGSSDSTLSLYTESPTSSSLSSDRTESLTSPMSPSLASPEMGRARDDLDMERALRPRINAPDVVRSTLSHKELKYNESTIDQLLGTPNKIVIPERYIPEYTPELSLEEKKLRLKKADAIRKMLSETTVSPRDDDEDIIDVEQTNSLKKKVAAEKRQRDHILQLNQILAKQVMEKSKMVAGNQAH
ncbi:hypothetical protein PV327_001329 [Microctonus hyperodae]|uniref:Pleckstrin homology domain-containing protein n=1 Tax=Microctonus hyperodae TaxID=165561 RepID=A0AA39G800_MICHY|nr:hypothetical protein PV327_001329 [Microctonus hyperodae]